MKKKIKHLLKFYNNCCKEHPEHRVVYTNALIASLQRIIK